MPTPLPGYVSEVIYQIYLILNMGSDRGDPLSPLIFNLSIEPLTYLIKSCHQISPITLGSTSHSVSQYTDDTLVYIADVQQSLLMVLRTLECFGYFSGYKVNLSKSSIMLINTDQSKVAIPLQIIVKDEVLYLGIGISSSLASIAKTNYSLVLDKAEYDIKRWKHIPVSVPAHVSVIKMNILPHINYISSVVPLAPPAGYWQKLDKLLCDYVWNGKRPRMKWSIPPQMEDGHVQILNYTTGHLF